MNRTVLKPSMASVKFLLVGKSKQSQSKCDRFSLQLGRRFLLCGCKAPCGTAPSLRSKLQEFLPHEVRDSEMVMVSAKELETVLVSGLDSDRQGSSNHLIAHMRSGPKRMSMAPPMRHGSNCLAHHKSNHLESAMVWAWELELESVMEVRVIPESSSRSTAHTHPHLLRCYKELPIENDSSCRECCKCRHNQEQQAVLQLSKQLATSSF